MVDRPSGFTVGDWTIHHTRAPFIDRETIVLIHSTGVWRGGSLELGFDVLTGQWIEFLCLAPENKVALAPEQVVQKVLTLLGADPGRIDREVFLAALASRYAPEHLLAAIRGSRQFR